MIYLAIAGITALATVIETKLLLAYLKDRDVRERDERSELLTRIQAPLAAPSLLTHGPDGEPLVDQEADEIRRLVHGEPTEGEPW